MGERVSRGHAILSLCVLAHAGTHVRRWSRSYPSVYYTFLSNVVHAGAQEYVLPLSLIHI